MSIPRPSSFAEQTKWKLGVQKIGGLEMGVGEWEWSVFCSKPSEPGFLNYSTIDILVVGDDLSMVRCLSASLASTKVDASSNSPPHTVVTAKNVSMHCQMSSGHVRGWYIINPGWQPLLEALWKGFLCSLLLIVWVARLRGTEPRVRTQREGRTKELNWPVSSLDLKLERFIPLRLLVAHICSVSSYWGKIGDLPDPALQSSSHRAQLTSSAAQYLWWIYAHIKWVMPVPLLTVWGMVVNASQYPYLDSGQRSWKGA